MFIRVDDVIHAETQYIQNFVSSFPILVQFHISIPPENVRKPKVF